MLILITAVPGSGKTLFAVELIQKFLSEGRKVYSNIDGLNIDSVEVSPTDWRECPHGSVVVYDECQKIFPAKGSGRSSKLIDVDLSAMHDLDEHRHRGYDIVLITQHPKLLHSDVRRLVGRHYHLFRMYGAESAKVFRKDGQIDVDKPSSLHAEDSYLWLFPKKLYNLYKSATVHTHKRSLPKWMIRGFIFGSIALVMTISLLYLSSGFFSGKVSALEKIDTNISSLPKNELSNIPDTAFVDEVEDVSLNASGCVWSDSNCLCYDKKGLLLNLSYSQCIAIADTPSQAIALAQRSGTRSF